MAGESVASEAELRAARLRAIALLLKAQAARYEMLAQMGMAQASAERFVAAFTASEAREIAAHPDLAELNVQMNGYYDGSEPS